MGAWYETLAVMGARDAKATAALTAMAKASGESKLSAERALDAAAG